jgi:3-deoxy-7-phosphoheptulonate synthase
MSIELGKLRLTLRNGRDPSVIAIKEIRPDQPLQIGGRRPVIMAGPCAVESMEQIDRIAQAVAKAGATVLRGGAWKPRTSPYDFQGLGEKGLKLLRDAADKYKLALVTEALGVGRELDLVAEHADIVQIGARNSQNFRLLQAAGKTAKPILLKRGPAMTYEELLLSAEYIMHEGNPNVILCERGIKTFETHTRNTLDIVAVAALREITHLPIIVDPSHGTGKSSLVLPAALAAAAIGADGLIIEVHDEAAVAQCDGHQAITPAEFQRLCYGVQSISRANSEIAILESLPSYPNDGQNDPLGR